MDDNMQLIREDLNKIDSKLLRLCNTVDELNKGGNDDTGHILDALKVIEKRIKGMAEWIALIGIIITLAAIVSVCSGIYAFLNLSSILLP